MAGKNQHVKPHKGRWAVIGEGNEKATRVCDTQREAIGIARRIARNQRSELVIHGQNGEERERTNYGK